MMQNLFPSWETKAWRADISDVVPPAVVFKFASVPGGGQVDVHCLSAWLLSKRYSVAGLEQAVTHSFFPDSVAESSTLIFKMSKLLIDESLHLLTHVLWTGEVPCCTKA